MKVTRIGLDLAKRVFQVTQQMSESDSTQLATIEWTRGKWSGIAGKCAREHRFRARSAHRNKGHRSGQVGHLFGNEDMRDEDGPTELFGAAAPRQAVHGVSSIALCAGVSMSTSPCV
jgi:hypothetical protein